MRPKVLGNKINYSAEIQQMRKKHRNRQKIICSYGQKDREKECEMP